MSLTNRIRAIERRLTALERGQVAQAEALVQVADAIPLDEEDDAPTPGITLDGEDAGVERDQSQPL